ncbi:hypothetical protein HH214_02895 [Mucilaginibacter robiniae]|uniref:DUF6249 domain-containing protein n=1 Tax=Mucilaginibacter robiniae TaxID=2728022 RepID=A0A7L5DUX4_9SPHI|nr:DUF6249 domain-containing protein [Mucilaginibacter robiniae]QJD94900.1 hypothetical protein HH214_02895 [Mucilaginibacter robiniae]
MGVSKELVGILVPLGFFAMVFGIVYLYKRERMAMIERGMDPRRYKPQSAPYQNLKWGLLLIGAGLGMFFAFLLDETVFAHTDNDNDVIYTALVAIFGGAGLLLSYLIEKKDMHKDKDKVEVHVPEKIYE